MNEGELAGRTALVTGGGRGIGRACCIKLAEAGADVAINYRSNDAAARETAGLVEAAGRNAHVVRADVSVQDDVQRMVAEVEESLGPVDLLVNNAGVFDFGPHDEVTHELWQRTLDCNLTGPYFVIWALKRGMIERGFGRIVNMSSISALNPRPMSIAYAVSKAGLVSLTQSLAVALAGHGIRINAVAPGLIDTDILEGVAPDKLDALIKATPIPRMGTPAEMAEVVLFLLSERSSFMTGQTLVASGGRVLLP